MACFLVPAAEAIVTTIAAKVVKTKENHSTEISSDNTKIKLSKKLGWLNNMLWGGSALLAFEHLWHGEIMMTFPFLTGAMSSQDSVAMLHEMSTVGVAMSVAVTGVWAVMAAVASAMQKKAAVCDNPVTHSSEV